MKIEYIEGGLLKKLFFGGAAYLEKNKKIINDLNVFPVPDGDTGTNMALTVQSAVKQVKAVDGDDIEDIAKAMSNGSLMGARGNSGVILSQLFRGFANGLKEKDKIDTETLANAFKLGSDTAYKAVMKPIEGTILTVARECAERALEICKTEKDIIVFLERVIKHGDETLQKTPEMLDALKKAGVVDAGGKGLLVILIGALKVLTGGHDSFLEEFDEVEIVNKTSEEVYDENIEFGYCTEFIINNTKADVHKLREEISKFGDSLLVVGGDNIIKIHVHTNNPGQVLERAMCEGELIDIKIDNMRYQHSNIVVTESEMNDNNIQEEKKYGFITVAMGDGIANVFKDLNVDHVITGGQTMNPSTEDILNAINNINAENIIVLPNNSNIVLAANQAKELSDKNIEVVPTKSIAQGISALLSFDEDSELEDNLENMLDSIKYVKTGQITYAVRDTEINGQEINKDDIMGICDGDIISVGNDIQNVALDLIEKATDEDNELITIFYGEDISDDEANKLAELLEDKLEDYDIEVVYGGQPLYYYIFSIE
ncbi:DAK2 domain-containing protein [Sporosalibacterium faouarense]|uniref:DAK2 domain-containing protein n=1 Tax=Sporosalibacterium faouarense TaxID=516123 RepID=UPI00141D09C9|nr:DAK2 domain-containing protein [Sporosalibacterium faouarense]MTI47714.1 DAK2 domain-containing protein [Bacillota bacterium]